MEDQKIEITKLECLILCGGLGSRLGTLTNNKQKCMLEFNGKPFLQFIIDQLTSFGIRNIIFATGKCSDDVESEFPYCLFSEESEPLGTGGAIKNALPHIYNDYFLVVNGDSYCDISKDNFNNFCNSYKDKPLILLSNNNKNILSSHFETDHKKFFGAGIYLFPKNIFLNVPYKCSLEHDILPYIDKRYYLTDCPVLDIGTPENLKKVREWIGLEN